MDTKPTVFIGSSGESESVARSVELNLTNAAHVTLWPHAFTAGRSLFEDLLEQSSGHDFAVIVMTPDDIVTSRGVEQRAPRDNVVFELGLFLGSLGRERVFVVMPENTPSKIMSDYKGVIYLRYDSSRPDEDLAKALSPSSTIMINTIRRLGKVDKSEEVQNYLFPGGLIGLERIYDNFDSAREAIFHDLRSTKGPIRIFIHIASQQIGLNSPFFDILEEIVNRGSVDVRVLHAGYDSPLFEKERLLLLGKDPSRVLKALKWASESLQYLEKTDKSPLRRRSHSLPFIWRMYSVGERLYLMPYFSSKDAVKTSPVLVFKNTTLSMYNVFNDWFDHTWQSSTPEKVDLGDIVSPASAAGSALLLTWNGKHVFGIPKRDISSEAKHVRFYGIGGKRENGQEPLDACALREAQEELSGALERLKDASTTTFVRRDGTAHEIQVTGLSTRPRLIMEKANHASFRSVGGDYTLVAFEGTLNVAPRPSRELAAVLLIPDDCLRRFTGSPALSLREILTNGGEIFLQKSMDIDPDVTLIPHGTAVFLIRNSLINHKAEDEIQT